MVSDLRNGWPAGGCRGEAPTVCDALSGCAVLEITGGATVRVTQHSVQILPPRLHGQGVPRPLSARARAERVWAQSPSVEAGGDILLVGGRIRATCECLRFPKRPRLTLSSATPLRNFVEGKAIRCGGARTRSDASMR